MLSKILKSILILIAGSAMFYGGFYIYQKQTNLITFDSFQINENSNNLHILDADVFFNTYNNTSDLSQFNLPKDIIKTFSYFSQIQNFNSKISKEIRLNYFENNFYLIFKHNNIDDVIKELQSQLHITSSYSGHTLHINKNKLFVFQIENYLVVSNQKISYKKIKKKETDKKPGNYNYSFSNNTSKKLTYFTKSNNSLISFTQKESNPVYGKPTKPEDYFKFIPSDYTELYFYGSSNFQKDKSILLNKADSSGFFIWVDQSFIHLKKDDKELIIGKQNDVQNLKYILDEQTIELSTDSLLPTSLFRNNFEISFFKTTYNWPNILPNTKSSFSVYSEFNNYNILGNSISAIDWFIRELQLGKQSKNYSALNLPQKVNTLTIRKSDTNTTTLAKSWISRQQYIEINSQSSTQIDSISKIKQIYNFPSNNSLSFITPFKHIDSLYILCTHPDKIICYTIDGEIKWQKAIETPLIKPPTPILEGNSISFIIFHHNKVDHLNSTGESKKGFPYNYNGISKDAIVVKENKEAPYRLIINLNNSIINLNLKAEPVVGWTNINMGSPLKSKISTSIINNALLICTKSAKDSIYVFNKFGTIQSPSIYAFKKNNQSDYINGAKNNLQILSFENNYIKSIFLTDGHLDSTKINLKIKPEKVKWLKIDQSTELLIEDYNHIVFYNEYGFVEQEYQKPKPNLTLLSSVLENRNLLIFANLSKNELYLLNKFGKQLNKNPILGTKTLNIIDNYLITYYNGQLWIYQLKLK